MNDPDPYQPRPYVTLTHPEWCKNAAIYQINLRQFTQEGTFKAAQAQLPRLKTLGADILWLMPVHPIGTINRKGTLGSPYSVKDYLAVNPEFGTLGNLKSFVSKAHELGMFVILDWVANHTAWDNRLVSEHPEWYARDHQGKVRPTPWCDWSDIIDLDFSQPGIRKYMTEALLFWVEKAGIDGYRCDVAGFVPLDFWENVRKSLEKIKPVFMLAEWESRDLHQAAFDMTYAWSWYDTLHSICQRKSDALALQGYYAANEKAFPSDGIRMTFVSNHDKNAWDGTMWEQFGPGLLPAIALSVAGEGMPLIYNGQEAGNTKRLAFFDKDPIHWQKHPIGDLYKNLLALMKRNSALWHAHWGGKMEKVPNNHENNILSFIRQREGNKIFALFNFSEQKEEVCFKGSLYHDTYKDFATGKSKVFDDHSRVFLEPWSYKIFEKP